MNIESSDGKIMQALRDSTMVAPEFPPANMAVTRLYDQMAYTDKGAATRRTRLIRPGVFNWRTAICGPHPKDAFDALPDTEEQGPMRRISHGEMPAHHRPVCEAQRVLTGKAPHADFSRS